MPSKRIPTVEFQIKIKTESLIFLSKGIKCTYMSTRIIMVHSPGHIQYCRDHYANSHCEQGCDSAPCGWDGSDCFTNQRPQWAKGTLVLHTKIPHQRNGFSNSSLFWALSVLLQTPVKLRASAPISTNRNLFDFDPSQLGSMLSQTPPAESDGYLNRYIFT